MHMRGDLYAIVGRAADLCEQCISTMDFFWLILVKKIFFKNNLHSEPDGLECKVTCLYQ